jgi:hypothetical protein
MRVENFNPNKFDEEFASIAIELLVEGAEEVAEAARKTCPVGTTSRPMYKTGPYAGKEWTKRDGGNLKKSIRVVRLKTKSGKAFSKKRNVRIYAGNYWSYYAAIVEFSNPFMRRALASSIGAVKSIIGAR